MELIVVLGILAILFVVAVPNFTEWRANTNLKAASREVFSSFQLARVEAPRRDTTVTICVTTGGNGTGKCIVFVDNPPGSGNGVRDASEPLLREMTVPKGITLSGTTLGFYRLNNRGFTVGGAGTVTLTNGKTSYDVTLTPAGVVQLTGPRM
jgi:type IV fimbrial biogenesis protein FimT